MLIYHATLTNCTNKEMRIHTASFKKKRQSDLAYDELDLEKLMQYYGFEKREQLLNFLKAQCIR